MQLLQIVENNLEQAVEPSTCHLHGQSNDLCEILVMSCSEVNLCLRACVCQGFCLMRTIVQVYQLHFSELTTLNAVQSLNNVCRAYRTKGPDWTIVNDSTSLVEL